MTKTAAQQLIEFRAKHSNTISKYAEISNELYQLELAEQKERAGMNEGKIYKDLFGHIFLIIKATTFKYYAVAVTYERIRLIELQHEDIKGKEEITLQEVEPFLQRIERLIAMIRTLDIEGLKRVSNL